MTGPLEFLQAAHARAEQAAQAATPGPWKAQHRIDGSHKVLGGAHPLPGAESDNRIVHRDGGYRDAWPKDVVNAEADADHIELHQPRAVLRRIAKERELLADHRVHECGDADCALEPRHQRAFCDACRPGVIHPCATVRLLAEGWGWEEGQQ